jgi:hypothetical protein
VAVRSLPDFRCVAELVEQDAVRRLLPVPATSTPDRTAAPNETRWKVEANVVQAGTVLRVTCHPASLPD